MNGIIFDEVCRETGLTEMNRDIAVETRPLEMSTEEPVDRAHEVNGDKPHEELFESTFNLRVLRKVYEVVDVQPDCQGRRGDVIGGIVRVAETAGEHAGV